MGPPLPSALCIHFCSLQSLLNSWPNSGSGSLGSGDLAVLILLETPFSCLITCTTDLWFCYSIPAFVLQIFLPTKSCFFADLSAKRMMHISLLVCAPFVIVKMFFSTALQVQKSQIAFCRCFTNCKNKAFFAVGLKKAL